VASVAQIFTLNIHPAAQARYDVRFFV